MSSKAENPGKIKFSYRKYYGVRNKINDKFAGRFYSDMQITAVAQALMYGDTQPAVVVSTTPLMIAAYSDEMDAVVMLHFPEELVEKFNLHRGSRLTASVVYGVGDTCVSDIFPGEHFSKQFNDFMPVVQLFMGKNEKKMEENVALFPDETWEKVKDLGMSYLADHPETERNGFYYFRKA